MRLLALLAAGLFVGALTVGCGPAASSTQDKKDEEAIVGKWRLESGDLGYPSPKPPTAEELAKVTMTYGKDGKMVMVMPDGRQLEYEYKLDPAAKPKALDLTFHVKGTSGTSRSVYELDGDTLMVAMPKSREMDRPTELKADGKGVMLTTFRRVKDE